MAVQLFVECFVVVGNIQSLGQERWCNSEVKDTESISNTTLFAENKLHLIVLINRLKKWIYFRSVFAYQVPRDDLVYKHRHHIWYSRIYWGAWHFVLIIQNVFSSVDLAIQIKSEVFPKCTVGDSQHFWSLCTRVVWLLFAFCCPIGSNCVHLCLVVKHCYLAPTFLVFNSHWFKDPIISDGESHGNLWLRQQL